MLAWSDLLAAFALYLVLEGIMPFLNPGGMKRAMALMLRIPDPQLRFGGFGAIVVGLVLLVIARGG
ncbi:MAG: DUF2065 domain-containing protein [Steroidobacteraceae bacterium]